MEKMNINNYDDWSVGISTTSKFYHHFYLKDNPHITMEFDLNSPTRDTVGEYQLYNTNMLNINVKFMCNGNTFCTRKVLICKNYGYVVFPTLSFLKRDEVIVMKNDDGSIQELEWDVYYDEEDLVLAKMVTMLLTDSINKKKVLLGNGYEKNEHKDYERLFERTKYVSDISGNTYYIVKFNGDIYSDNGKQTIDDSEEWED